MSDIAIRLDGLLLAAALILTSSVFLLVALLAWSVTLISARGRPRLLGIARRALCLGVLNCAGLLITAFYIEYGDLPTSGPDIIDWLSLPVLALFVVGCALLARFRPA